jgi:hypothetical protein
VCAVSSTAPDAYDGFGESKLLRSTPLAFINVERSNSDIWEQSQTPRKLLNGSTWSSDSTLDPKVPTAEELVMAGEVEEFFNRSSVASSGRSFRTKWSF